MSLLGSVNYQRESRRRPGVAVVAVLLAASLGAASQMAPAYAASNTQKQAEIKTKISKLTEDLNEVSGDEAELLGRLDEINNRKTDVENKIAELTPRIDQVQRELDSANVKLAAAQSEVTRSEQELQVAQNTVAANTAILQSQAVDAYIGKTPSEAASRVIAKASDLSEASAANAYMRQVVNDRRDVVEEKRELEGQARDLKQRLDRLREQAEVERGVIARHEAELASQRTGLDALRVQVQTEADAQNQLLAEAASKRDQFEAQIAGLQRESDNIANILRGGDNSGPVITGRGVLQSPVPGAIMTSPFGTRVHPIFGTVRLHAGQDYGVPIGTTLRSAADGTVATAGWVGGYGNYTCVKHSGGLATCYAHQSQILVSVGDRVSRGQVIGKSGNTGNSTGPHLHFEVRANGNPVDPRGYL